MFPGRAAKIIKAQKYEACSNLPYGINSLGGGMLGARELIPLFYLKCWFSNNFLI